MPNLRHKVSKDLGQEIGIKEYVDTNDPATEDFQIDWLIKTSGKLTDTLTPIFEAIGRADV